jgi:hypothetical protein
MNPEEINALYKWEKLTRTELADHIEMILEHCTEQANQNQKLEAMWIEERAKAIYPYNMPMWENIPDEDHPYRELMSDKMKMHSGKKYYREQASSELALEPISWKHIGPKEQEAIQAILSVIDAEPRADEIDMAADVLRTLLEGLDG